MSSRDKDHDFEPYDGTPGKKWDDFKQRLMDYAAGKTDDRGESLADFYLDQSEGQAGGAALPAGAAEVRKAQLALRRRQKDAYALLMRHIGHADHKLHMPRDRRASRACCSGQTSIIDDLLQDRLCNSHSSAVHRPSHE